MKIKIIALSILSLLFIPAGLGQTISEQFDKGMDAYHDQLYADAQKIFLKIIDEYGIEDELYASARFYSANSLLKMGKKDEAAAEEE